MTTKSYPYLRAWCRIQGSSASFTEDQVRRAIAQKAPATAIFERYADDGSGPTGEWATYETITRPDTLAVIERVIAEMDRR
jgi:hypothetical protein